MLRICALKNLKYKPPRAVVQRSSRLVAEKNVWLLDDGPGNGDALLFSAGELR
ncbi:hypothetical protein RR42_m1565 [Cupriavidus basilensis]|uniref:Uncharacterized protein n=1 Tax=Cupriavidus basilensis TaxID=68895 RepID=A0A0C4Y7M3_9BURK|nr:hypothetical protein RR42_m1565 [Cupriavidus basilensis]